jgi:carbonic anhydrase
MKYTEHLACYADDNDKVNRLCELNVISQVLNAAQTTVVQNAWERGQKLAIHGWVYSLVDGRVRDLGISLASADEAAAALKRPLEKSVATLHNP